MKVIVERSGGFAGIIRRGEKDLSALSPEQQTALQKLLDKGVPPASTQMGADKFTYKVEVQDERGSRSLIVPEAMMPASLACIATGPSMFRRLLEVQQSHAAWRLLNISILGSSTLPKRWIVERTFAWISRNRRLARDFERYAGTVAAFVRLAMIRIMLKRLTRPSHQS